MDGDVQKRWWYRYIGVVCRGSALYYWGELEDRVTVAAQGGGGPIVDHEVEKHTLHRECGLPLVRPFSILHTDSARACSKLHRARGIPTYNIFVCGTRASGTPGRKGLTAA